MSRLEEMPLDEYMRLRQRVANYVEGSFQRSGQTAFPTVRQVARRFRIRQGDVELIVGDSTALDLTSWRSATELPLGDHFVESYGPEPTP